MEIQVSTLRDLAGPLEWSAVIDRLRRTAHPWLLTMQARCRHSGRVFATDEVAYFTLRERNEALQRWEDSHIKPYGETLVIMDAADMRADAAQVSK